MATTAAPKPQHHRFNVSEFYRMADAGLLAGDARVELIDGEIFDMTPIGSRHAGTVKRLAERLHQTLSGQALVSVQDPIRLGDLSEPEPDIALLRPRPDFYTNSHPEAGDVLLIIEVADSSLEYDRTRKLPLYARHGIAEAWLVDLENHRIERFSSPGAEGYQHSEPLHRSAAPLVLPDCPIVLEGIASP